MAVLADAPYTKAAFTYPDGYISEAKRGGLALWNSDAHTERLTRLEVALVTAQIGRPMLSVPPKDYALPFTDVPEDAREDIALLAYNHVISGGTPATFNPKATCSRGQAAQMLTLVLDARYREEQSQAEAIPSQKPLFDPLTIIPDSELSPAAKN